MPVSDVPTLDEVLGETDKPNGEGGCTHGFNPGRCPWCHGERVKPSGRRASSDAALEREIRLAVTRRAYPSGDSAAPEGDE